MRIDVNSWYYSPDHGQLCQVIEIQTLWGDTTLPRLASRFGLGSAYSGGQS
jgi:hypothetical protein